MILIIAKWIVILFGVFIFMVGLMMLFAPEMARSTLRKAGSTNLINYGEITIRLIPATALILYSEFAKMPLPFWMLGWFMLITSLILYVVPRNWHHNYSLRSAELLTPRCFQFISPFAFLFGAAIIYNTVA